MGSRSQFRNVTSALLQVVAWKSASHFDFQELVFFSFFKKLIFANIFSAKIFFFFLWNFVETEVVYVRKKPKTTQKPL